jgi:hypothetical protein
MAGPGQLVAVAMGHFDPAAIQSFLDSRNIRAVQVGDYRLYGSGTASGPNDTYFSLVDSETIVLGPLQSLERVLRVRDGQEDNLLQSENMMALIDRANGEGIFWGVLNSAQTGGAIERLVPDAVKFPMSADLMAKMSGLMVTVNASGNDVDLDVQTASDSKADAVLISQLMQAGILLRRYQTKPESNPELARILEAMSISTTSNMLDISVEMTDDQLISLIEHNTFTMAQ